MGNIRNIEPKEMPVFMGSNMKFAEYIKFISFTGYNFDDEPGSVKYEIYAINRPVTDQGLPLEYHELLAQGEVALPSDLVHTWGEDDEPVIDYVINSLGLKKL